MAMYHLHVSICSGSQMQSAIASCAYQSGEKLRSEVDGEIKAYTKSQRIERIAEKGRVLLPKHAPQEYLNREKLWNSVQQVEGSRGQYARKWDIAIPTELSIRQAVLLVEDFCQREFISRGMCADWSIHDDGEGNPHVHIMTTMRPILDNGAWGQKSRKVLTLDKHGNPIPLRKNKKKKGAIIYKKHKEFLTDWDQIDTLMRIRTGWAEAANRALEQAGCKERITEKSYDELGIDKVPTIHEGYVAQKMEQKKKGSSFRVAKNNEIRAFNDSHAHLLAEREQVQREISELEEALAKRPAWLIDDSPETSYGIPSANIAYKGIRRVALWQENFEQEFNRVWNLSINDIALNESMMSIINNDSRLYSELVQPIHNIDLEEQAAKNKYKADLQRADAEIIAKQSALEDAEKIYKLKKSDRDAVDADIKEYNDSSWIYRKVMSVDWKSVKMVRKAEETAKGNRQKARDAVESAKKARQSLIKAYNDGNTMRAKRRQQAVGRFNSQLGKLGRETACKAVPALATLSNAIEQLQSARKQAENIQQQADRATLVAYAKTYAENPPVHGKSYIDVVKIGVKQVQEHSPLATYASYATDLWSDMYQPKDGILKQLHKLANENQHNKMAGVPLVSVDLNIDDDKGMSVNWKLLSEAMKEQKANDELHKFI